MAGGGDLPLLLLPRTLVFFLFPCLLASAFLSVLIFSHEHYWFNIRLLRLTLTFVVNLFLVKDYSMIYHRILTYSYFALE